MLLKIWTVSMPFGFLLTHKHRLHTYTWQLIHCRKHRLIFFNYRKFSDSKSKKERSSFRCWRQWASGAVFVFTMKEAACLYGHVMHVLFKDKHMNYFAAEQFRFFLKTWRQEGPFVLKYVLRRGIIIDYNNHYTERYNEGECECYSCF